ncbi:hypothetical protein QE360_001000 [Sphingomonas sp. SORGH_AS789]|nr:hypothetical protein [Sphingomonas sp. SORGH_AS_0789]
MASPAARLSAFGQPVIAAAITRPEIATSGAARAVRKTKRPGVASLQRRALSPEKGWLIQPRGSALVLQVHRRILAATIDFDLELQTVALVQRTHAGALDGRNVNERVGLAVVALNEAEALHRVEELDRASRLLAGQLALRGAAETTGRTAAGTAVTVAAEAAFTRFAGRAILDRKRLAFDLQLGGRDAAAAIDEREAERLAFRQAGQAGLFDRRNVDEHVFAAVITHDKAEALLRVEELDDARALANDLGGHAAATTAAEAATAAATETAAAAAEAITAAEAATIATTAEAVAATEAAAEAATAEAITAAEAATKAAFIAAAEIVPLVATTRAAIASATSIETHKPCSSSRFARKCYLQEPCAGRRARVFWRQTFCA